MVEGGLVYAQVGAQKRLIERELLRDVERGRRRKRKSVWVRKELVQKVESSSMSKSD